MRSDWKCTPVITGADLNAAKLAYNKVNFMAPQTWDILSVIARELSRPTHREEELRESN